jgi:proteasome lid subunit RPN8/RPN11
MPLTDATVPVAAQVQCAAAETAHALSARVWRERRTECGGLVWGRIYRGQRGCVAWVAALTPGIGPGTASTFEIAPASYVLGARLLRVAGFPDRLKELGLWHSHPGYGAWLSAVDEESFRLCHPEPWKLSIVVDPVRREWGVFVKARHGVREIPGYLHHGAGFGPVPALDPGRAWEAIKDAADDR